MSKQNKKPEAAVARPGKMAPRELEQWMTMRRRSRQFTDRKKQADKSACRGRQSR